MRCCVGVTKKLIPVIFLIILFMAAIIGGSFKRDYHAISLKQAIDLCFPEALRWSSDARLAYAISTETGEQSGNSSQGKDGLWPNWNIIFVEEKTRRNLLVAVRQGRMAYTRELLMAFKNPINHTDLKFDSTAAISLLTDKNQSPSKVHYELVSQQSPVLRIYLNYPAIDSQITSIDETSGEVISQWDCTVD